VSSFSSVRREVLNTRPAEPPFPNGLGRAVLIQVRGRPDGSWQLTIRDDGAEGALVDTVGTHPNRQGKGPSPSRRRSPRPILQARQRGGFGSLRGCANRGSSLPKRTIAGIS
jgi:hypothetical protein